MTAQPSSIDQPASISDPRTSAGEPVIKCAGLTKVFRDFWLRSRVRAVDGLDLEVRRGEVFGLLGPNGSGKSTTIKMILGLLHPSAGRIAVFGRRPDDVLTKKNIGYLPEESYLYRFLNARETLEYYSRLFHQSRVQRRRRIDTLLQYVGLEAVQRRPVGEYSKGMQRRIGIAQALINDPQLLILDEPTSGMDPIGTRQVKDLILDLKRVGKTILLCSHLLADVEDVCDRVAIMYGGKVRAAGSVDELLVRQDLTTLQTDSLDVAMIEEIEALLEKHGKHIERVERPRQRLEALFLDIVQQAHAQGVATSGAQAGSVVPDFLIRGDEAAQTRAVIEQLVTPPAAAEEKDPGPGSGVLGEESRAKRETSDRTAPSAIPQTPPAAAAEDVGVFQKLIAASPPATPMEEASVLPAPVEEKPDKLFIDALTKVEPFQEGAGAEKASDENGGESPQAPDPRPTPHDPRPEGGTP